MRSSARDNRTLPNLVRIEGDKYRIKCYLLGELVLEQKNIIFAAKLDVLVMSAEYTFFLAL